MQPLLYRYDGSFEGFLCCVFDSYARKEQPTEICEESTAQLSLFPVHRVVTDPAHAKRVFSSLRARISAKAEDLVLLGFLTCMHERERVLLQFIRLGFRYGAKVTDMLSDPTVSALEKAVGHLREEAHLLLGFVRFSEYEGRLAAVISPKNQVLPLMQAHFCARFPEETFCIYDDVHKEALLYRPHVGGIFSISAFSLPEADAREQYFRSLWRVFYETIAIQDRENPKCRQTQMPKRYWPHLTEMRPE